MKLFEDEPSLDRQRVGQLVLNDDAHVIHALVFEVRRNRRTLSHGGLSGDPG